MGKNAVTKKRKRATVGDRPSLVLNTAKPSHVFQKPHKGRNSTLSIALPSSIITNAQGLELKTILAGRIARAAAVFCVDEIVIFDDGQNVTNTTRNPRATSACVRDADQLLELLLSFAECPPYLRKSLFTFDSDLGKSGLLPSLDIPHHLKPDEWCQYREGVSLPADANPIGMHKSTQPRSNGEPNRGTTTTQVDVGFIVTIPVAISPYTRVTVKFDDLKSISTSSSPMDIKQIASTNIIARAVDPEEPRKLDGYYWGYTVRRTSCLSSVITTCPHEDGYDYLIGTSERGESLSSVLGGLGSSGQSSLPTSVHHVLVVFGGVAGLEAAANFDTDLRDKGISAPNVSELFDVYVNACPGQGSRTIRTEEAVWITLAQLQPWFRQVFS